ncbi:MAG: hypothetical protein Q7R83_03315 [bacterium]|nr:hypothetical protein [bacterium]
MEMKKIVPIVIVALLIVGGGAFYGGMKYEQGQRNVFVGGPNGMAAFGQGAGQRANRQGAGGQGQGAGFTTGDILSMDGTILTLKLRDGGSKIVLYSTSTSIQKMVEGVGSDLVIGKSVSVVGSANTDGSITAQSIQMRPAGTVVPNGPGMAPTQPTTTK